MFEKASRLKLRFETSKGFLSTEDLWDLNLISLDNIYRVVNKKIKDMQEDSLLAIRTKDEDELRLKIEIISHIVKVKQEEAAAFKQRQVRRAELELLKSLKEEKQVAALKDMSLEDLDKRIEELEKI